ncbi:hypothetical protein IMY05_C4628000800 [Salix suchowensis]|nr:hypothetical protein IMY05_C4628000800 [Salix suchowensis]
MILYTTPSISVRRHSDRTRAFMSRGNRSLKPFPSTPTMTGLFPTPLPSNFEPKAGSLSDRCRSSYDRVVSLERRYILLEQLSPGGIEHLARSIQSCLDSDDASLTGLGRFYAKYFVKICDFLSAAPQGRSRSKRSFSVYRQQGRTPAPSLHPSRPSFDQNILERDDHRDLIARDYDEQYMTPEAEEYHAKVNRPTVPLEAAHIIPEYLANTSAEQLSTEQEAEAVRWLGSDVPRMLKCVRDCPSFSLLTLASIHKRSIMWIMLQHFGAEDIYNDVGGDRIHHPSNLLTLSLTDHHRFDYQSLWFEPLVRSRSSLILTQQQLVLQKQTHDEYHYKLCVANASARPTGPDQKRVEQVVFQTRLRNNCNPGPQPEVPCPSRCLLSYLPNVWGCPHFR